nr:unnamed protein product [Callosobruchus chinensis]
MERIWNPCKFFDLFFCKVF